MTRQSVAITTAADGSATVYTATPITGLIHAVQYTPDGTVPLDTGADLTITGNVTGIAILTLTNLGTSATTILPRAATTLVANTANAAEVYAGTDSVNDRIPVCEELIKVVVAQGGDTKKGTLTFYVDE